MTEPVRAVFMGSDSFSVPILTALLQDGHRLDVPVRVVGAVTQPDRPAGRGRRSTAGPVKDMALRADLPVLQPERLRRPDAIDDVLDLRPDVIVVASFGQIVPSRLLHAPRYGALNLHPSLLPRYRGPSPIVSTLLAGDSATGTSLMLMSEEMDAGPVLAQETTEVGATETGGELTSRLASLSAHLLLDRLPAWLRGDLVPQGQDAQAATYTQRISREDAHVDWSLPSEEIARRVRAFNPSPVAYTDWKGVPLRILAATPIPGASAPGNVTVVDSYPAAGTGEGLLRLDEVHPAGGRPQDGAAFLRGHRDIVGATLEGVR